MSSSVESGTPVNVPLQGYGLLPPGAASHAFHKGMLLRFKKEIPQAIDVIEKSQRLFLQQKNYLGVAFCLIELAWLAEMTQERGKSEKLIREAELIIDAHQDLAGMNEARARWLHYKGLSLYQLESYGPAMKLFKMALTFCHPQGLETAKIYDSLGVHYERTGDFHRAVRYLKTALQIKNALEGPPHEEAVTCQILGRLHLLYEDYDLALEHIQRSLEICSDVKDEKRKASLKNELIRLFLRCNREEDARRIILENRQECFNRHLKIQYAMTYFYEVYLLYNEGQYEQAEHFLEREVLSAFRKYRYNKGLAMAKRLQAWIVFALNPQNTTDPVSLIGEAIELFRFETMIDEVAKSHFELGKLYHETNNDKLALASYLDALKMAEENGLFYLLPYIEDEIFRTHEPQWEDVVNKRTQHERIFEKRHSLLEALNHLLEASNSTSENSEIPFPKDPRQGQNIPFLISLLKVGQTMAAERDLDKLLEKIKAETEKALKADRCVVFLYDALTNELWSKTPTEDTDQMVEVRFPAHQGLAGYVAKTGEILNVHNAPEDPRFNPEVDHQNGYQAVSMLCVPMKNRKGVIIGVFQVLNKRSIIFRRSDEDLLIAIASSAGIALENAQLNQELKKTFESLIKTLSHTIDARDPITAGHSERVMEYSLIIGEQMRLSEDEMEALKYAALLHDIGKIGVKEEILIKEGRLTEKEYLHIQQHVQHTHIILQNIHFEKHLSGVPEIASSHHEKMDGSGYFRGAKGEQIPLGGRILAVADVFDAITSKRQYRTRMPFRRVIEILRADAGKHFDANIVSMFLEASLRDLARVLCLDKHIKVPKQEVTRILNMIPTSLTVKAYCDILEKEAPSREESQYHQYFNHLYHFSEISDKD